MLQGLSNVSSGQRTQYTDCSNYCAATLPTKPPSLQGEAWNQAWYHIGAGIVGCVASFKNIVMSVTEK